jgi:hypothetical protein
MALLGALKSVPYGFDSTKYYHHPTSNATQQEEKGKDRKVFFTRAPNIQNTI